MAWTVVTPIEEPQITPHACEDSRSLASNNVGYVICCSRWTVCTDTCLARGCQCLLTVTHDQMLLISRLLVAMANQVESLPELSMLVFAGDFLIEALYQSKNRKRDVLSSIQDSSRSWRPRDTRRTHLLASEMSTSAGGRFACVRTFSTREPSCVHSIEFKDKLRRYC